MKWDTVKTDALGNVFFWNEGRVVYVIVYHAYRNSPFFGNPSWIYGFTPDIKRTDEAYFCG